MIYIPHWLIQKQDIPFTALKCKGKTPVEEITILNVTFSVKKKKTFLFYQRFSKASLGFACCLPALSERKRQTFDTYNLCPKGKNQPRDYLKI